MPVKPIFQLQLGEILTPMRFISPTMVAQWVFAKECSDIGGAMMPGAELRIVEKCDIPGKTWVRVQILSRSPDAFLKINGDNLANNFDVVKK